MATKESIMAELTRRFTELGRELGFSEPVIQNRGHQTDLYMLRKGHALQMEILWGGMVEFINVVRLYDGQLPDGYVEYTNPDGSWRKRSVYRIYGVEPVHQIINGCLPL